VRASKKKELMDDAAQKTRHESNTRRVSKTVEAAVTVTATATAAATYTTMVRRLF
jgi:hypothetical protein